ncbi:scarecrow-like protein 14 [Humulus lupulus]|uniref:scarecrow-like protein 14 n=1 Tax=Humulus lupulus TaxID=3486 RepID=UPI002B415F73|nr:scarecrow-like protein 14 [Humulus lupulus]
MDPSFTDYSDFTNSFIIQNHSINLFSFEEPSFPSTTVSPGEEEGDSNDENEFSIYVLKLINQILMEENMEEEETSMFNDPLGLQLTEKSFYDALGESYPYSTNQSLENPDTNFPVSSSLQPFVPMDNNFQLDLAMAQKIFRETDSISQFKRGFEEASKFLPKGDQLISPQLKNHQNEEEEEEEEERSNKKSAHYIDESHLSEMFDRVLLQVDPRCDQCCEPSKVSGRKGRGKRQKKKKKEIVDLRNLLISCAQAVSIDDTRAAHKVLKQIREHSSPNGDGSQRLAHFFANGLDARLAGIGRGGSSVYSPLLGRVKASDLLKAFHLNLCSCPFRKMAMLFANKSIMQVAEKATTLHIVDFGILYGFQWPIFIERLSKMPGGPPNLRITGIEFPQDGFRPKERVEETGRRLAEYCERFGVPFRYNAIATKNWESIRVEEIELESNEVVAVNCMMRLKHIIEESVENCPRNAVLSLIRKMNPAIFVNSIVNGSYNAPFFVTRFREALFHYSALFDMLDATVGRENQVRVLYEREIFGREIVNVVACEGEKRVERPETYKQWHVRCSRTGFRSRPLDQDIMRKFKEKLRTWYHKDFVIDQDSNWMLQGWKGRIAYASSCWLPA